MGMNSFTDLLKALLLSCLVTLSCFHEAQAQEQAQEEVEKEIEVKRILEIPILIIPVIEDGNIQMYYGLQMRLELKNKQDSLEIQKKMPRLTDRIFTEFYKIFSVYNYVNQPLSNNFIRKRVVKICKDLFHKELIKEVLIDNFTRHLTEHKGQ